MTDFDASARTDSSVQTPTDPEANPSPQSPPQETTEAAAFSEFSEERTEDANPFHMWGDWQGNLERLRQQAESTWQQGLAQLQLQFDRDLQLSRDRLMSAAIASRNSNDVQPLVLTTETLLSEATLNPEQLELVVRDIPTARDRALIVTAFWHAAKHSPSPVNQPKSLSAKLSHMYGESGCPLVRDRAGEAIDLDLSVALLTAWVAGRAAEATMAGFTQFLGRGKRNIILRSDDALRRKGLQQSQAVLDDRADDGAEVEALKSLMTLDADGLPEDALLELLTLGIQGAQVGEFVAKKTRGVLDAAPPVLDGITTTLQFLMSDLVLSVSNTVGSSLENSSVRRRVQLFITMLPEASQLPTPQQYFDAYPQAIAACSPLLAPIFAQQLVSVAEAIDPQERNVNLNRLGRQFNQINPWQFVDGWLNGEWLERWRNGVESLCSQYPQLEAVQTYRVGLERAANHDRLMDQAVELRKAGIALDPEKAENMPEAATQ